MLSDRQDRVKIKDLRRQLIEEKAKQLDILQTLNQQTMRQAAAYKAKVFQEVNVEINLLKDKLNRQRKELETAKADIEKAEQNKVQILGGISEAEKDLERIKGKTAEYLKDFEEIKERVDRLREEFGPKGNITHLIRRWMRKINGLTKFLFSD